MIRTYLLAGAGLLLAACFPPTHSEDYNVPFARGYWRADASARTPLSELSVEQLYALNEYGRRAFHPWRSVGGPIACRGAAAIPFLKSKISPRNMGTMLEIIIWMRWLETYDVDGDADLQARLRSAFAAMPKDLRTLYADNLALAEGRPASGPYAFVKFDTTDNLRERACKGYPAPRLDRAGRSR
jgi:hypothetical protein